MPRKRGKTMSVTPRAAKYTTSKGTEAMTYNRTNQRVLGLQAKRAEVSLLGIGSLYLHRISKRSSRKPRKVAISNDKRLAK